jgi:hypothetical protein
MYPPLIHLGHSDEVVPPHPNQHTSYEPSWYKLLQVASDQKRSRKRQ